MTTAGPEGPPLRRPLRGLVIAAVAVGAVGFGWLLTGGADRLPPTRPVTYAETAPADDGLETARAALLKEPYLGNCRAYLQQLNAHLDRHPEQRPRKLSADEHRFMRDELGLFLGEEFWDSNTFEPLDAHYLEMCLFLADAARSLNRDGASEKERARAAFQWVTRQVRLTDDETHIPVYPAHFVLRRGSGDAVSRVLCFLALLEQLDIPGCLITCKPNCLAGAIIDERIYLFDPVLGIPVPGPAGKEMVTLADLLAKPGLLPVIDPLRVEDMRVFMVWSLLAVTTRMRFLEDRLAPHGQFRVAIDPLQLHRRLQKPLRDLATAKVKALTFRYEFEASYLLRHFLPEEEGGYRIRDPKQHPPMVGIFRSQLVPFDQLPAPIAMLDKNEELGRRLRAVFAAPFEELVLKPGGSRDLLLRGQLDQATAGFVSILDQVRLRQDQARAIPNLDAIVRDWCQQAERAQANLRAAQRAVQSNADNATEALQLAQEQVQELWSKKRIAPVLHLLSASAAEPLTVEVAYQLALCKHEQAERLQTQLDRKQDADAAAVRDAWRSVAERWRKFLDEYPKAPSAGQARLLAARALEILGDRPAALTVLREGQDALSPWERRACSYRAQLLQAARD